MATMNPPITERRHIPDRRSTHMAEGRHDSGVRHMTSADWIPMVLLAIGGINWGLIGLFDFNLVSFLFGEMSPLSRIIYVVVGACALYALYLSARLSRHT